MSAHDALLATRRRQFTDGTYEDRMDSSELQPDSLCAVLTIAWGGPDGGTAKMPAPDCFDTPGDFVAFVRVIELPRSPCVKSRAADADDLLDVDEPQMVVKRLTDAGGLDLHDPERIEMVPSMLSGSPEF